MKIKSINMDYDEALEVVAQNDAPFDVIVTISASMVGKYDVGGIYRRGQYLDKCVGISPDGQAVFFKELRRGLP